MGSHEDLTEFEQEEQYYANDVCLKLTSGANQVHQDNEDNQFDNLQDNEPKVDPHLENETENCETEGDGFSSDKNGSDKSKYNEDLVGLQASGFISEAAPNCPCEDDDDVNAENLDEKSLDDVERNPTETLQSYSECNEPQLTIIGQENEDVVKKEGDCACLLSKPDLVPDSETSVPEPQDYFNDLELHENDEEETGLEDANHQDDTPMHSNDSKVFDVQEMSKVLEDIVIPETNKESFFEINDRAQEVHGHEDHYSVDHNTPFEEEELFQQEQVVNESSPSFESSDERSESSVVENTPVRNVDVVREDDPVEEVTCLKKGFAKDLAGFWSSPKGDACAKQVRQPIELPKDDAPSVVENIPQRLDGVVRSDDAPEDYVTVEHGRAKMMVNLFQSKKEEVATKELKLDINFEEPGIYENDPQEREGIVKSSDVIDDIKVQKGVIKMITDKFLSKGETNLRPREVIKIEPAQGPSVIENNPEPPMADVIRSDAKLDEDLPSLQGMTKTLVHKWKTNDLVNTKAGNNKIDDLDAILKAGMAAESGVFENQPSVRTDVAREDDEQADIIPAQKTKSTRDLWNQKINQESRPFEKAPQLVRFTPPRELSPPRQADDKFKSFQQITLA